MKRTFLLGFLVISRTLFATQSSDPNRCAKTIASVFSNHLEWKYGSKDPFILPKDSRQISEKEFKNMLSSGQYKPVEGKWHLNGQDYEIGIANDPYNDGWGSGWHPQQYVVLKNVATGEVAPISPQYGSTLGAEIYTDGQQVLLKVKHDGGEDLRSGWPEPDYESYALTPLEFADPNQVKLKPKPYLP